MSSLNLSSFASPTGCHYTLALHNSCKHTCLLTHSTGIPPTHSYITHIQPCPLSNPVTTKSKRETLIVAEKMRYASMCIMPRVVQKEGACPGCEEEIMKTEAGKIKNKKEDGGNEKGGVLEAVARLNAERRASEETKETMEQLEIRKSSETVVPREEPESLETPEASKGANLDTLEELSEIWTMIHGEPDWDVMSSEDAGVRVEAQ